MNVVRLALVYFGIVFGVGFALGPLRVGVLEPRVGPRTAELIEAPLMLAAIVAASGWLVRRYRRQASPRTMLGVGLIAVALILVADVAVGVALRGMSAVEVFTNRDPASGAVYYGLLALFAALPGLLARRQSGADDRQRRVA